ncbi:hypothetical protein HK100_001323 [Physocladia obscura]|uniref:DUF2470 domain-containing protein n=1 Tax=Physocladia obscura TaxID=109957 RepID=A0AAD5SWZ5_9FUNG|nr:hypothetical protein HK100_001323 [Physocladia obscura]
MAPVQRKKTVDPVSAESHELAKELNTNEPDAVIDYIQHFGHIPDVFKGRVIGVDSTGFDCLYTVYGQTRRREIRIVFDQKAESPDDARATLKAMAKEAHKILHNDVDKTYVSPSPKTKADWTRPKPTPFAGMGAIWLLILVAVGLPDESLPHSFFASIRHYFGGIPAMTRLLKALVIIHAVESLVAVAMCLYARVPAVAVAKWIPTVFVFGVPSLQDCMRVCVRRAMYRDPVTFGVPENVLNGHYMKYRRIITDADLGLTEDGTPVAEPLD